MQKELPMGKNNIPALKISLISGLMVAGSMVSTQASALKDVIEKAKIDGFAFTRIQTVHGKDGEGTKWQWRFRPTITTGEVAGWSGSAGILFSKGSGTPDGSNTDNDISGSRGDRFISASDVFNISDFFITYSAKEQFDTDFTLRAGQKNAVTPYNDTNLDRAMGIFVDYKDVPALNIGFQWWDTWMGDDIYLSRSDYSIAANQTGAGIGNNVFMLSLSSGKDFTEKTGLSYQVWYAYIHKFAPYMVFGDISYTAKFGSQSLGLLGQVSALGITRDAPVLESGNTQYSALFRDGQYNYARDRGMYNIRLDYKYNLASGEEDAKPVGYFGLSVGFAGSFGEGYGTLIDNTGALKLGGNLWNNFSGVEANGFGLLGVGGFRGSSITLPYAKIEFAYKKFSIALDAVYVKTSHFYYLKKGGAARPNDTNLNGSSNIYGSNKVLPAEFVEVSPSVVYRFTNSLNMAAYYGYLIGNPSLGRFRFQVNYLF